MQQKERYQRLIDYFERTMPVAETELNFGSPFQLLVAVILSAQCTDKRVNMVTPALFERFPTSEAMAEASVDDVFALVRSVSYPNAKSRHLVAMAQMLQRDFGGEVPQTLEELVRLPGVGRKTANVMQAVAWKRAAMPVDTHIFRVSHRIGLVPETAKTPCAVEMILTKNIPSERLGTAHHWLLLHGRYVCQARKPKCEECGLREVCKYFAAGEKAAAKAEKTSNGDKKALKSKKTSEKLA